MIRKIYIILLNWNGWRDTVECLESVFRLEYGDYTVVVCDNDSSDGSFDQIRRWAKGELKASCANSGISNLVNPPVSKPIAFIEFSTPDTSVERSVCDPRLVLIQCAGNLGYAGGNNVGLRYALAQPDCEFVWLLNNDTVVQADALTHLVNRMQQRPHAGICGSTLISYSDTGRIQACGGASYNKWLARGTHLGTRLRIEQLPNAEAIEERMAYVVGASMLVRRSFLEQVGLMNEEYFLYFEEIDWSTRAKGRYALAYSPSSIVYHKEGASIGSGQRRKDRSLVSERYAARNRIAFTKRYSPAVLPFVVSAVLLAAAQRMLTGSTHAARVIVAALFEGFQVSSRKK